MAMGVSARLYALSEQPHPEAQAPSFVHDREACSGGEREPFTCDEACSSLNTRPLLVAHDQRAAREVGSVDWDPCLLYSITVAPIGMKRADLTLGCRQQQASSVCEQACWGDSCQVQTS